MDRKAAVLHRGVRRRPLTCASVVAPRLVVVLRSVVALRSVVDLQVADQHQVGRRHRAAGQHQVCHRHLVAGQHRPITATGPLTRTRSVAASGLNNLISISTTEVHPILTSATKGIVTEPRANVRIVVADAFAMAWIVLPVIPTQGVHPRSVDVDIVVAPIASAAPIISARRPTPKCVARTKRNPRGNESLAM